MDARFTELLGKFLKFADGKPITEDSDLRALGLDSMQSIELLFAIEDTYGVSLPDDEMGDATFATAGSLWRAIATAGAAA
ncbi:phosphopantetheine-binding protein [Actinosynnema sp. ALI-1.44]|uniref:acyl carrier protein n=1 Tax=Actinosynnema sp. ALI-1.44 TaxID=1933779 RepID=UPI00097CABFD|nr:acyl carrier protein [Actinosynnema sp. ALI-1.44]ONI81626.1 phosphopantetheine-binding protein [Actinosynnema sp. ALI-1.44]